MTSTFILTFILDPAVKHSTYENLFHIGGGHLMFILQTFPLSVHLQLPELHISKTVLTRFINFCYSRPDTNLHVPRFCHCASWQ